jgi:hypothetical protein
VLPTEPGVEGITAQETGSGQTVRPGSVRPKPKTPQGGFVRHAAEDSNDGSVAWQRGTTKGRASEEARPGGGGSWGEFVVVRRPVEQVLQRPVV